MAGYSSRTLSDKLGIKPDTVVTAIGAPPTYATLISPHPSGMRLRTELRAPCGFIHLFVTERQELVRQLPAVTAALASDGMLWISWPKQAARVPTDITEDTLRAEALPLGLVDVKVCAVDDTWSGLKFVYRRGNRSRL